MSGGIIGGGKYLWQIVSIVYWSSLDSNVELWLFLEHYIDEVGAIVVDMGSHTTRVGYAGEDMPKVSPLYYFTIFYL